MRTYIMKLFAGILVVLSVCTGPFIKEVWAAEQSADYAPIDLRNSTYTIEAVLKGDEGITAIQSPMSIFVDEKKATAVIVWDSPYYNYMIVDGEMIMAKSHEGGSVFWIPVTAWDEEIPIVVNKGTGSGEELSCSLYLDSSTIKKQGTMTPLYVLIVLNIILAFLNALNMIRKRNLFAERVETAEEAEKFAKQQAKRPSPAPQPQKRLVLDENGNFVTADVFESAKQYQAEKDAEAGSQKPAPPQDAPAPQLWWRRTGEETLIIDRKDDGYRVKEIRPAKPAQETDEAEQREKAE